MGVLTRALVETQAAFDGVAADYGRSNDENPILCAMRARVYRGVSAVVPAGSHILDLGCGPGADAVLLARNGYRVTAVDWSAAMVAEARRRVHAEGVSDRVDVQHVGIHELERFESSAEPFDAACSNFGPLNCVGDLASAAHLIADHLKPGGVLVASVIGRVCPWEIALYLSRGELSRAFVRFRRGLVPVPLDGRTVWTRYISPGELTAYCAAAGMTRVSLRALGLFVPPPYLQGFAQRHPAWVAALQRVEDQCGDRPILRELGDHFLAVFRKS